MEREVMISKTTQLENEFNVSKIIAVDQGLDDSLINTKDDPLNMIPLISNGVVDGRDKDIILSGKSSNMASPQKNFQKPNEIKLEYEEILDDKWDSHISK